MKVNEDVLKRKPGEDALTTVFWQVQEASGWSSEADINHSKKAIEYILSETKAYEVNKNGDIRLFWELWSEFYLGITPHQYEKEWIELSEDELEDLKKDHRKAFQKLVQLRYPRIKFLDDRMVLIPELEYLEKKAFEND